MIENISGILEKIHILLLLGSVSTTIDWVKLANSWQIY